MGVFHGTGKFSARKLKRSANKFRWSDTNYAGVRMVPRYKSDPLEGAPQGRGIVREKIGVKANSRTQPSVNVSVCS